MVALASMVLGAAGCRGCASAQHDEGAAPVGASHRIVSQTVISDEILWDLGQSVHARVVGVSKMADDPTYSGVAGQWPQTVPRIPGSSEALIAARPDLVVVAEFTAIETTALLQQAGIEVLRLEGFSGFDDFRRHVMRLADAVDAPQRGRALVRRFDAELQRTSVEPGPDAPTVVSWIGGTVAGANTIFDDESRAAGLINAAATGGLAGHGPVAVEQVVAWNPRILVTSCAGDCDRARRQLAALPGLSSTAAVRGGHVVALEPRLLYSSGFGMVQVVQRLSEVRAELL
jgi:iron complex transport system substrate-binding protein